MNNFKRVLSIVVCLVMLLSLFGCASAPVDDGSSSTGSSSGSTSSSSSSSEAEKPDLQIAAVIPMTGEQMQFGILMQRGMEIALEEHEEKTGIHYDVQFFDDKGDPKETVNVVNKALEIENLAMVVGPFSSSCALAAAPVMDKAKCLLYSPNAGHVDFPVSSRYAIPFCTAAIQSAYGNATDIYNVFDQPKISLLYMNTDSGVSTADYIVEKYEELGGTVVSRETFISGTTKDFKPILTKIMNEGPDKILINAMYNDAAIMVQQAEQLNIPMDKLLIYGQAMVQEFIDLVGDDVPGLTIYDLGDTRCFDPEDPEYAGMTINDRSANFARMYKEKYGEYPNKYAAMSYDSMCIAIEAVENADGATLEECREQVVDYILNGEFPVCDGNIAYYVDEWGNAARKTDRADGTGLVGGTMFYAIENGQFVAHPIMGMD